MFMLRVLRFHKLGRMSLPKGIQAAKSDCISTTALHESAMSATFDAIDQETRVMAWNVTTFMRRDRVRSLTLSEIRNAIDAYGPI